MRTIDADVLKEAFEVDGYKSPYIARMIDACPTVGEWISVNDRLPEKLNENNQVYLTEKVIGYDGESAYIGQFKVYNYDGFCTFFDGNCFRGNITHWMPLPLPPK